MVPRDFGNGDRTPEYTYPVIVGVDGELLASTCYTTQQSRS